MKEEEGGKKRGKEDAIKLEAFKGSTWMLYARH